MFDSTPYSTSLSLTITGLRSSRTGFSDERDHWQSARLSAMERGSTNLENRLGDPYVKQVPRIARIDGRGHCISLWTEEIYCLRVDGKIVEVPDLIAQSTVLIEDHFARQPLTGKGFSLSPPRLTQTEKQKTPIFGFSSNRLAYHLRNFTRYLFLEYKEQQQNCFKNFKSTIRLI